MTHHRALRRTPIQHAGFVGRVRYARERGSFAVMGALWLVIALVVLGSIDIGYLYFERRDLQRIADMASQGAVQTMDDSCTQAPVTALAVAQANSLGASAVSSTLPSAASPPQPASGSTDAIAVECGRWDIAAPPTAVVSGTSPYFSPKGTSTAVSPLNAVWVQVTRSVPYFFLGPTRTLTAMSTARATNIDTFSIGTTIASVGGSNCSASSTTSPDLVNWLVSALLGSSSEVQLSIGSYQALACSNIKLGDLATAAVNAGYIGKTSNPETAVSELLQSSLTVAQILGLSATALSNTTIANVDATLAGTTLKTLVSAASGSTQINIGNDNQSNPLFQLGLANGQSAANAVVNLFDLVTASAEVAQAGKSAVSLSASAPLGGLASGTTIQVQIVHPPAIATGEAGINPSTGLYRTSATTATIGIYVNLSVPLTGASIDGISIASINLPIYIEVATGTANLVSIQCNSTLANSSVTISAQPGIANVCIGQPPLSNGSMNVSSTYSCNAATLVNVLNLITVSEASPISVQAQSSASTNTFSGDPNASGNYWTVDSDRLGTDLSNALTGLLATNLNVNLNLLAGWVTLSVPLSALGITSTVLSPVFTILDTVLTPLLELLGVQVGAATVHQIGLACGVPQIVY
jgi:uncharacterized membrane protein